MSYHDLSECTLTEDERRAEANRICAMLGAYHLDFMQPHERQFIERKRYGGEVSVKELFWMRDLTEKYL